MKTIDDIKALLAANDNQQAAESADALINNTTDSDTIATAYYLRGLAMQRQGRVREALNCFLEAMELQPDGPAAQAYRMQQTILDFYDHDLYNP